MTKEKSTSCKNKLKKMTGNKATADMMHLRALDALERYFSGLKKSTPNKMKRKPMFSLKLCINCLQENKKLCLGHLMQQRKEEKM